MKEKMKDFGGILLLVSFYVLVILIKSNFGEYILGSTVDFDVQHYIIPEYLRNLFYETHNLFPDFSFHLGAGVNIYCLSYYGLFNPIMLISYLLPEVKMLDFIIVSMGIVVISSCILFYYYLKKNGYSRMICFLSSFLLLCSAPFIFHSHRHIMFMDYFPFLILGLFGVDIFVQKKKSFLLIISVVLIIFTSYYFSISEIVALFIYGIFKYIRLNDTNFVKFTFNFGIRFLIAVLISSVLIFPTLYVIIARKNR